MIRVSGADVLAAPVDDGGMPGVRIGGNAVQKIGQGVVEPGAELVEVFAGGGLLLTALETEQRRLFIRPPFRKGAGQKDDELLRFLVHPVRISAARREEGGQIFLQL